MKTEKIVAIITGPSAVGKTTIVKGALKKLKKFKPSTTYTTRKKRKGTQEDKLMNYISENEFKQKINDEEFIEWAQVYGNFYGTSKSSLNKTLKTHNVLMNIDVQGAQIIKKKIAKHISIFILPENINDIKTRLETRKNTSTTMKRLRLQAAQTEIGQSDAFDYKIINYNNKIKESIEKVIRILEKY